MNENLAEIGVDCVHCGDQFDMVVPIHGLIAWKEGMLIQDAMPELSADERELLISGTCGKCWDEMFPECWDEMFPDY